jgi:hypothetical protein
MEYRAFVEPSRYASGLHAGSSVFRPGAGPHRRRLDSGVTIFCRSGGSRDDHAAIAAPTIMGRALR